jgi:hypothetical protein
MFRETRLREGRVIHSHTMIREMSKQVFREARLREINGIHSDTE